MTTDWLGYPGEDLWLCQQPKVICIIINTNTTAQFVREGGLFAHENFIKSWRLISIQG